jgi:hypothetical protein
MHLVAHSVDDAKAADTASYANDKAFPCEPVDQAHQPQLAPIVDLRFETGVSKIPSRVDRRATNPSLIGTVVRNLLEVPPLSQRLSRASGVRVLAMAVRISGS